MSIKLYGRNEKGFLTKLDILGKGSRIWENNIFYNYLKDPYKKVWDVGSSEIGFRKGIRFRILEDVICSSFIIKSFKISY